MLRTLVLAAAAVLLCSSSSAINLPGVPTAFTQSDEVLSAISADIANKFAQEYVKYQKTGVESALLRQLSTQLAQSHSKTDFFTENTEDLASADQFFLCVTCRAVVNVFTRMFRDPEGELNGENAEEDIKRVGNELCIRLTYSTAEVCSGLIDINYDAMIYIMRNSEADSQSMCGMLPISFCSVQQQEYNWHVTIDPTGPALTGSKADVPKASADDWHILHLTDIHYDPNYVPDSLAECSEWLCCQRTPGIISDEAKAGYWSDYRNCDSPLHMIENGLDHIKQTHAKIDFIYHTGDIIPHNVWITNKEENIQLITKINDLLAEKFPGIPVYSTVGNHEPHPCNTFGPSDQPDDLNIKWLYEHLYQTWSKHLPADTRTTIEKGGYYTVVPKPGFRIISINDNDGYLYNWWIYLSGKYASEQLNWLHDTLLAAEAANEHVHILTHIPTGNADMWNVWAREFNMILERFNHIISGIFTGHTHRDEINVHYNQKGYAIGVSWNGGSLTSYTNKNPNYKVYHVEEETKQVVDYETWIFNLTEANAHGAEHNPAWFKEYQFSEAYTSNASPDGLDKWLLQLAEQPDKLRQYYRYKVTSADPRLEQGCDDSCLMSTLCRLATTNFDDKTRCKELQEILAKSLEEETTTTEPEPEDPDDDGAAALTAFKVTTLLVLLGLIKIFI